MNKGIGGHTKAYRGNTDSWITPREIIDKIGPFDLDPCVSTPQPWSCAAMGFDKTLDGLKQKWHGRVFLNSPYGPETVKWLEKLSDHGNGIALTFARTDTTWFHSQIFSRADGILFLAGRLTFCTPEGKKAPHNSGGPSVLVAYGSNNSEVLRTCDLAGKFITMIEEFDL